MFISECLNNVRCDTVGCHKFAKYNISTSSYKGNMCICLDCYNTLFKTMQKLYKENLAKSKNKGDN